MEIAWTCFWLHDDGVMVSALGRICVEASSLFAVPTESPDDWHTRLSPSPALLFKLLLLLLAFKVGLLPVRTRFCDEVSGDMSLEPKPKHPIVKLVL